MMREMVNQKLWAKYEATAPKSVTVYKNGQRITNSILTDDQIRKCYGDVTTYLFDYLCEEADEKGKATFSLSDWYEQYTDFDLDDLIDRLEDNGYKVRTRDTSRWYKNTVIDYTIMPDGSIVKALDQVLVETYEIIVRA